MRFVKLDAHNASVVILTNATFAINADQMSQLSVILTVVKKCAR